MKGGLIGLCEISIDSRFSFSEIQKIIYLNYGFLLSDLYMDVNEYGIVTFNFGIVYGVEGKFNKATYNSMKDWIDSTPYLKIFADFTYKENL